MVYRSSDILEDFETRLEKLEKDHDNIRSVAESYTNWSEMTRWAAHWMKFGMFAAFWLLIVLSVAIAFDIENCSERHDRRERAVENCNCDFLEKLGDL